MKFFNFYDNFLIENKQFPNQTRNHWGKGGKMRRNQRGYRKLKTFNQEKFDKKFINYLSISIIILFVLLLGVAIFYHVTHFIEHQQFLEEVNQSLEQASKETSASLEENNRKKEVEETDTTFTMTAIGDIMCHNTQYFDAYQKETDTYDFSYVFENINRYIKTSDIAIGSLETSFAGKEKGYSNYPTFNSPDELAYDLKKLGLDVLSTAGNHCLDMGFDGLSRTIDVLDDADISHLGTYQTQEERNNILFKYVKGIKIAFINYTYGTNGIPVPSDKKYCVNLIDKDLIKSDIENAKTGEADIIVACMHWGTEYKTTANKEQQELADFLFQNGVDIILGNHPHVLEPMEKRTVTLEDGTQKDGFIIFALGNFICDQNTENTRNSIILNLKITKHIDGKITIDHANYIPIYMDKMSTNELRKMKLLDIEQVIYNYEVGIDSSIGQKKYDDLKIQLEKIKKIVGPEF